MGAYALQAGWADHFRPLAGHLPRSMDTVRVIWDMPEYTRRAMDDEIYEEIQRIIGRARDAAVDCLRAYRDEYGVPLRQWEYAVTPDAGAPPAFITKTDSGRHENTDAGTHGAEEEDLVMEYKILKDHLYGESNRPEDDPWRLSGYAYIYNCSYLITQVQTTH